MVLRRERRRDHRLRAGSRRGSAVPRYSRRNWRRALIGGALRVGAYGIALWAMTRAPIALVAVLRETAVIFGAVLARACAEGKTDAPAAGRHRRGDARDLMPCGSRRAAACLRSSRTRSPWCQNGATSLLNALRRAVVVAHGRSPSAWSARACLLDLVAEQRAARGAEHRDELVVVADVVAEHRAGDAAADRADAFRVALQPRPRAPTRPMP